MMTMNEPKESLSRELRSRLVRYTELQPCTNAFIDARTPGSDQKENFTIIGPGVAENPHQYVHIREPHGFNIGGARQPPRCTNSLHSHNSEEVFMIQSGTWRFVWGEFGDAGSVVLNPGDTISIPIHVFRGFENIGTDVGFMFAILGGDDPGHVHWAPHVISKAQGYGLILLDNGSLVDTTLGEVVPPDRTVVGPSTSAEIAYIRVPTENEMLARVVRRDTLRPAMASAAQIHESAIIGADRDDDGVGHSPITDEHGFTLRHIALNSQEATPLHSRHCVEVLLVHRGRVRLSNNAGDSVVLVAGDTFSVPVGMPRRLVGLCASELFVVRGGNSPGALFVVS